MYLWVNGRYVGYSGIEEEFDIEIPTEVAEQIVSVSDAIEQIKNALN